ncbi:MULTISPECIES: YeeE/YedE family protein [Marinobacter]|jgi:uncharacterized membrane protein YedE/YeeE|uniref:Lipocalin-related protein and Bos/Can/Equ allergen n=1 Tax=Marinobacter excellens LAMA 842 TaxID=1306954 RepID=A0A137SIH4_9GAMM|nr:MULTISPECIES: YeeE/YedE family protein [Marinobacter]KXO12229.1 Lipocalin-related protein and Bos/Can/Equ allergen [Marinobacter excellens LAMA 842]MCD1628736.1 YeeE/YedE family protein [Marinobacter shengliensis]
MGNLFSDHLSAVLWAGALLGVVYGMIAQWSRFCLLRGLFNRWQQNDSRRLRAFALAMAVALISSQWLAWQAGINLTRTPYHPGSLPVVALIVGGLLFGYGMALANACGARSLVLLGTGNLRSLLVLLVLGIAAYMTMSGVLAEFRLWMEDLYRPTLPVTDLTLITTPMGLDTTTGRLALSGVLSLALIAWALSSRAFRTSPRDWLGGLLIGLLVAAGWWITGVLGADDFDPVRLASLTFVAPVGDSLQYLMLSTGTSLRFGVTVVAGIVAGSLLVSLLTREFVWQSFTSPGHNGRAIVGGFLMGVGGIMSIGCTLGQGLSGFSTLAISSFLALAGIVAGSRLALRFSGGSAASR